jgi:hypothetical protein
MLRLDSLLSERVSNASSVRLMEHAATLDLEDFEDAEFQERIDNWLTFCRMLAEQVREEEVRFRQTRREAAGQPFEILHQTTAAIEAKRAKHLERLGMTGAFMKGLLDEFNKKWPPAAKDNPHKVPGESEGEISGTGR